MGILATHHRASFPTVQGRGANLPPMASCWLGMKKSCVTDIITTILERSTKLNHGSDSRCMSRFNTNRHGLIYHTLYKLETTAVSTLEAYFFCFVFCRINGLDLRPLTSMLDLLCSLIISVDKISNSPNNHSARQCQRLFKGEAQTGKNTMPNTRGLFKELGGGGRFQKFEGQRKARRYDTKQSQRKKGEEAEFCKSREVHF